MEELISLYLFKYQNCLLPHVGRLNIRKQKSAVLIPDQKISGPVSYIEFIKSDDRESASLAKFIASKRRISKDEAAIQLNSFCNSINQLFGNMDISIPGIGKFKADPEGVVMFQQEKLPDSFMPQLPAVKVIRPDATHTIIVGDKETDSSVMTSRLQKKERQKKDWNWIWPAAIALVAIGLIIYYYSDPYNRHSFGNGKSIIPAAEPVTYSR